MTLDFSRCRIAPYAHQRIGVEALVNHPYFLLADDMGLGKTFQAIVAAQFLFEAGVIDRVFVIAPASVRSVWYDPELGELAKHLFVPSRVFEFHSRIRSWSFMPTEDRALEWIITNYDYARTRVGELLLSVSERTLLILDESSAVKNSKTQQAGACLRLREGCGRVVLLNGLPIANHPGDMFSQGNIMSRSILNCSSYTEFCARYAVMKPIMGPGGKPVTSKRGFVIQQPASWIGIDDLQQRFAPYVMRRLKSECLDLPAKIPSVILEAKLSTDLWHHYKSMRDDCVAWITSSDVSMAPQIITKIMRLAQVTSGFLGGIQEMDLEDQEAQLDELFALHPPLPKPNPNEPPPPKLTNEVGREKLDVFLQYLEQWLEEDPNLKLLVWSRFRPEILRLEQELKLKYKRMAVGTIIGSQSKSSRDAALRLLDPRTAPRGPVVVIGNPASGGVGLNLTAAHTVVYMSNDFSLFKRLQSEDRVHRPGQVSSVSYFDIIAVGPSGQRTVDHVILKALLQKYDLATFTTDAWVHELSVTGD